MNITKKQPITAFLILFGMAISLSFTSCKKDKWPYGIKANNNIVEETRQVSDFDRVDFDVSGELYITQDSTISAPELRIKTSSNIMKHIETDVKGNTLKISNEKCIRKMKTFEVYLVVKDLEAVTLNGSGNIEGQGTFRVDDFKLDINGSGNMDFDVKAERMVSQISGSGNIYLSGTTDDQEIDINGSGDVSAFGLSSKTCYVNVSGSGNCQVDVSDELDVNINGSGNVTYEGQPRITFDNSGSGSLNAR